MSKNADDIAAKYGGAVAGPDPDEVAKKYGGSPTTPPTSFLGEVGHQIGNLYEGVKTTAKTAYQAFGEVGDPLHQRHDPNDPYAVTKSLLSAPFSPILSTLQSTDPNVSLWDIPIKYFGGDPERARQLAKEGSDAASLAAMWTGPVATMGIGALAKKVPGMVSQLPATYTDAEIQGMASLVGRGARAGNTPQQIARDIWPLKQQAVQELGQTEVPTRRGFRETASPNRIETGAEQAIDLADHMVDISERPLNAALDVYKDIRTPEVQQAVVRDLLNKANEYADLNGNGKDAALAKALRGTAQDIQERGGTVGGLNDFKAHANKEINTMFGKSTGQQIAASAQSAYAYRIAADAIRDHLYPEIQKMGGPDLSMYGQRESSAIQARDGIYDTYYNHAAPEQASRLSKTYLEYLTEGSLFEHKLVAKGTGLYKTPLGRFNEVFNRALGKPGEGFEPESVTTTPTTYEPSLGNKMLPPPPGAQPGFAFTIQGEPTIQTLHQLRVVQPEQLFLDNQQLIKENPNYTGPVGSPRPTPDSLLPTHYQPPYLSAAQSSADQLGSMAHAIPERSFTGPVNEGQTNWQYLSGSETDPLRKAGGQGILQTNNPKLVENTIQSIDEQLKRNPPPLLKRQLQEVQADLVKQLADYQSNLAKAMPKVNVKPGQVNITPQNPGVRTNTRAGLRYGIPVSVASQSQQNQP